MVINSGGALHGYDGRIVYCDPMTAALHMTLTDAARSRVRAMVQQEWQGVTELAAADIIGHPEVASASIRISDCVARSEIVFGPDLEEARRVVVGDRRATIPGRLPEIISTSMRGASLDRILGSTLLRGHRTSRMEAEDGRTAVHHHSDTAYLIDPITTAESVNA